MTDDQLYRTPNVARILMSEEAIYGLILVSGMVVVVGSHSGTALNAFITVAITVVVFFAAHVYAGTLGRMAATNGAAGLRASLRASAGHSTGLLLAAVAPLAVLLLGATRVIDDESAMWGALIVDTFMLAALGWVAVARWSTHWSARLVGAIITAAFGGVLIGLKALIHN